MLTTSNPLQAMPLVLSKVPVCLVSCQCLPLLSSVFDIGVTKFLKTFRIRVIFLPVHADIKTFGRTNYGPNFFCGGVLPMLGYEGNPYVRRHSHILLGVVKIL